MKVIAKNDLSEYNITGGRTYEVIKVLQSTEIGLLYQLVADDGKVKNLKAIHFQGESPVVDEASILRELVSMHRRQFFHNRQCFERECRSIIEQMTPGLGEESVHLQDINEFIDEAKEYLMAMMFHVNSLHVVGLTLTD